MIIVSSALPENNEFSFSNAKHKIDAVWYFNSNFNLYVSSSLYINMTYLYIFSKSIVFTSPPHAIKVLLSPEMQATALIHSS